MKPRTVLIALIALLASNNLGQEGSSRGLIVAAEDAQADAAVHTDSATGAEAFEFQAETNRLMDIIINSLYKSKEIFLRELISNASDALDKLRFMAVSDPDAVAEGDQELRIRISADKEARTLTITDTGVGMTRADLIANLGTIAKSGTTNFVEAMGQTGDLSLIGQFGVGFYSIYLAADRVQVISKHKDDDQHIWESTADSTFTVRKDPAGNTLGRGTSIVLHLKEDADEFLDDNRLSDLIHRYSEFITFPIYQLVEKEVQQEAEDDGDDDEETEDLDETAEQEEEEEEGAAEEESAKTETVKVIDWQRVNKNQAIWARSKDDITDEEYQAFYKSLSKDTGDAAAWIHFKAEGDVEFKSILFAPETAPYDMYERYYERPAALKLYVRKVLIKDDFEDLMPRYLNFVKGVVDSDDLPLNVSREMLQNHKVIKVMGKKLVRKTLDMLKSMSEKSEKKAEDDAEVDQSADKYLKWYEQFSRNIKMGITEDSANRSKLIKLLRFKTSKSDGKWVSLSEYVKRTPEWQKNIFFMSGPSAEAVEASPFMEKFRAKDIEVLYLTEPADEYCINHVKDFDSKKLISIDKEGVRLGDENEKAMKSLQKHYKAEYTPLTDYLKNLYKSKVTKVLVGRHAGTAPCLILSPQYGQSANMERLMRAQAFAESQIAGRFNSRIMEINPRHPLISKLNELVISDAESKEAADLAWVMFDTAMAASGFSIEKIDDFSSRIYRVLGQNLDIDSLELLPEAVVKEEEEDPEALPDDVNPAYADMDLEEMMATYNMENALPPEEPIDDDDDDMKTEL